MKYSAVLLLLSFFILATTCGPKCDFECEDPIDFGVLPDSITQKIPYINGDTYSIKHSNGQIINYVTELTKNEESIGGKCCPVLMKGEAEKVFLTPDYPVFSIRLEIHHAFHQDTNDRPIYNILAFIGNSFFYIPQNQSNLLSASFVPSIEIDGNTYINVYKMEANNHSEPLGIAVDSLYYNYEKGILKIKMTNNEYYEINQ